MSPHHDQRRSLVAHAGREAFSVGTRAILARLGYPIVLVEDRVSDDGSDRDEADPPDLRIVDERRLGELTDDPGERPIPIVLLTGRHGASGADPRIMAAVKRPAGLHELYRVFQQAFEEVPRSTPRAATHITCTCRRRGQEWSATLLSLSDNGALLRSPEPLPLGTEMEVEFNLPSFGPVHLCCDTAYQLPPDLGLVFHAVAPVDRQAIRDFVVRTI